MLLRVVSGGGTNGVSAGRVDEVEVEADRHHRIGDLIGALIAELGLGIAASGCEAIRQRGRSAPSLLEPSLLVSKADLLTGDTIVLTSPGSSPGIGVTQTTAEFRLVVASGPDAGRTVALTPDSGRSHVLGRDPSSLIPLTDATVSRRHAEVVVSVAGVWVGPLNGVEQRVISLSGETLTQARIWRPGEVLRLGSTTLALRRPIMVQPLAPDRAGLLPFQRTPYFSEPVQEIKIREIRNLPVKPEGAQPGYLAALTPLVMGVAMAVITGRTLFLLFALLSPVMVIGTYFDQRRRNRKRHAESLARFESELDQRADEIASALNEERRRRVVGAPDVAELWDRIDSRSAQLWIRGRHAEDFLHLRVGLAELATKVATVRPDGAEAEIRDRIDEVFGAAATLQDVPAMIDLVTAKTFGIVGRVVDTAGVLNSLLVQAGALHSPEDLVIAVAVDPLRGLDSWVHWLPHTRSASSPLAGAHVATNRSEGEELITEILIGLAENSRRPGSGPVRRDSGRPHLLVVLDQRLGLDPTMVARLLDAAADAPISVVWLAAGPEEVPRQAQALLNARPLGTGLSRLDYSEGHLASIELELERVSVDTAGDMARSMAPIRDASSVGAATALPRVAALFATLGFGGATGSDADGLAKQVSEAWKPHLIGRHSAEPLRLAAPIGLTENGPLVVDLVAQGPHALIGGTSGSGKSELLMSLVAGLIARQPPTRANLLFIDYKGGASSDVFRRAPHTVGYVTNLDGHRARRALVSLGAELDRRMALLQGRAKDLAEMVARHPDEAPPSLVIVVDEFATLVKEIPDFVVGIIDIAQRGRSLGIHLVLATQRPSAAIDENIKANTNLRIALRMLDNAESNAVIGAPDAATIPTPLRGRGYISFGAGDLVAFQSAWSGAPHCLTARAKGPSPISVRRWTPRSVGGVGHIDAALLPATDVEDDQQGSPTTQLDVLLASVEQAADRLGLSAGPSPWLEELSDEILLTDIDRQGGLGRRSPAGRKVMIGMIDDPEHQLQYPAMLDLETGGTVVVGSAGSGKSTLLQTIAISAARDDLASLGESAGDSSAPLAVFVFDFASRQLVGLQRLAHCVGVATGDDLEALTRHLDVLDAELERRRTRLADAINQGRPVPVESAIVILIDAYDVLMSLLDQSPTASGLAEYGPRLARILSEGRAVGLFPVISVPRMGAIRAQVASAMTNRIVLRQSDPQGYVEAGVPSSQAGTLELKPGQGILNATTRLQVALAPNLEELDAVPAHVFDSLADLNTKALPRSVELLQQPANRPLEPVIGIADLSSEPVSLDLRHDNLIIVGEPRTGRSTAASTIAQQVSASGGEVWVVAPPWSPLADELKVAGAARRCFVEGSERIAILREWADTLKDSPSGLPGTPRLLVVDDLELLSERDPAMSAALEPLLAGMRWVAVGSKPRGFNPNPIAQVLRQARSMVYLQPADRRDAHEVLGFAPHWHPGLAMVAGRGLVVVDRRPVMVQFSASSRYARPRVAAASSS